MLPPLQNDQDLLEDSRFDLPEIPTSSPLKKPIVHSAPTDDPNDFDALARRLDALKRK